MTRKYTKWSTELYRNTIVELTNGEFDVIGDYVNCDTKITFIHNAEGNSHHFTYLPHTFRKHLKCPVCSVKRNHQIVKGVNDFNTLYPELSIYLNNYEDGYAFSKSSGNRNIELKCPYCGYVFEEKIENLIHRGFRCKKCNDKLSYPNKFILNSLLQIKENFKVLKKEYSPDWAKFDFNGYERFARYDIYFELLNGNKYIIEMDGGLGHGNLNNDVFISPEISRFIDNQKDKLASEHEINVIRIDCNYKKVEDRYVYILNNILSSELNNILDLSNVDFDKSNEQSIEPIIIKASDLWNKKFNTKSIAKQLYIDISTVRRYLYIATDCGLCEYSGQISFKKSFGKSIVCLNYKEIFQTVTEAANKYRFEKTNIIQSCKGKKLGCGRDENTGYKLVWVYYEEYINMSDDEIQKRINLANKDRRKVICLYNLQIFNSIKEAGRCYNMKNPNNISSCCNKKRKYAGKAEDGTKLQWMYYEDYLKLNNNIDLEECVA